MDTLASSHVLVDGADLSAVLGDGERPRKLAVLGLPWDTNEDTLKMYFAQFGALEQAEVMKDRYTGKSRGFGFVTFLDPQAATQALATEHSIDGRRCEAKIALPKGEPTPPRTTRIFVARIPPSVTEVQFRQYFDQFGKLQDAYMPKDHSKQGYRGIGFVTFASPESVEKVMAVKHWMNGHEIAIDRATPKEEPSVLKNIFARMPLQNGQRRSFDNGAGIIGPGLTSIMNVNSGLIGPNAAAVDAAFTSLRSLSPEDRELTSRVSSGMDAMMDLTAGTTLALNNQLNGQNGDVAPSALRASQALANMNLGLSLQNNTTAAAAAAATTAALQTLQNLQNQANNNNTMNLNLNTLGLTSLTNDLTSAGLLSGGALKKPNGLAGLSDMNSLAAGMQQIMAAAATGRRSLDSGLKRMENPAIATARAGPRIFIGKLTKDTSEADVKEYFMRFGYVMDVYLPKSKDNKAEHRGFGFVTFETEAAIQRVVSHGTHRLKGSTIAIDIAMPKVEDAEMNGLDAGPGAGLDGPGNPLSSFHALPNLMVQRI